MHAETNDRLTDFFAGIIGDAIGHIAKHEDPLKFLHWFEDAAMGHYARHNDLFETRQDCHSLTNSMGRAIWNATPLPGNGFRPRPLPALRRNDPCPCQSGKKFKRCCGGGQPAPTLDSNALWPVLVQKLPASTLEEAIASGRVPIDVLIVVADEWMDGGKPKKAVRMLEPLFKHDFPRTDEDHDYVLNQLCNIYDVLGHVKKKMTLLQRVIKETKRSPLRSGAKQRLAAISMDAGDNKRAWDLFQSAQRDHPASSSLGALEVQLLMAEGKPAQASERAKFWARRLQNEGWPTDEDPVVFLNAIASDPNLAMAQIGIDISGGAGQRLLDWLDEIDGRAVPEYRVTLDPPGLLPDEEGDRDDDLARRLAQMGIPKDDIPGAIADLQMPQGTGKTEPPDPEAGLPETHFLTPPPPVSALQDDWHEVFPMDKPFSTGMPGYSEEVWDPVVEDAWTAFLEDTPAAFDSLDILDDLAMTVLDHEQFYIPGVDEKLLQPILRRAQSIIDRALDNNADTRLVWSYTDNRPALRCMVQLVYLEFRRHDKAAAVGVARQVLSLNPDDNHGLRTLVMNALLQRGDDEAALLLADQYPRDMNPDICYGKALALFRLDRRKEAAAALQDAMGDLPKVPRYLTRERIRKPKLEPVGILVGGDDQAWIYRQEMRDAWLDTPGALEWLKKAT